MLLTISVTVIAAFVVLFVIVLIPVALQILRVIRQVQKILETVRPQITPITEEVTVITKEISSIIQSVHRQVDRLEEGVSVARDVAQRFRNFEEAALNIVEAPVVKVATMARAASRGIGAFVRYFRGSAAE